MRSSTLSLPKVVSQTQNGFNRLLLSVVLMNFGDGIARGLYPLIMRDTSPSALHISLVGAVQYLPALLLSMFFGVWIDRSQPESGIRLANQLRVIVLVFMAVAAFSGWMNPWILVLGLFLVSSSEVFVDTAVFALIPRYVDRDEMAGANSKLNFAQNLMNNFIGKPVGAISQGWGAGMAISLHALVVGAALWPLRREIEKNESLLRSSDAKPTQIGSSEEVVAAQSTWKEMKAGGQFVLSNPLLSSLLVISMAINFSVAAVNSVFVLLVTDQLGLPGWMFGFVMSGFAIGGLGGALLLPRLKHRTHAKTRISSAVFISAIGFFCIAQFADSWILVSLAVVLGASASIIGIDIAVLQQKATPTAMLGRVNSVSVFTGVGVMPIGSVFGGIAADSFGLAAVYTAASGLILLAGIYSLMTDFASKPSNEDPNQHRTMPPGAGGC